MKKTVSLIILGLLIMVFNLSAFADCVSGFACSIEEIKEKEQIQKQKDIEIMEKYLKNKKDKKLLFTIKSSEKLEYNELFNPGLQFVAESSIYF